jgi:inward rectifier potassium channel
MGGDETLKWHPGRRPETVDTSEARRLELSGYRKLLPMIGGKRRGGAAVGIRRIGLQRDWRGDFYHNALTLSWPRFLAYASGVYLATNVVFALLYMLQPGAIASARPGSLLDAFFFSVETIGTIGYGVLYPATTYANVVMTVETLVGIMLIALTTGLMFARVSRPTARVLFANVAVVTPYQGTPMLMVRMGNQRTSQIVQAEVTMTLVRSEHTSEGDFMRRFYDLKLERSRTPIFAMSFQAMHKLDEMSPLYDCTPETLLSHDAEIIVTVTGTDETMAQTVHARTSYGLKQILFGHRYADIFGYTEDGAWAIDYGKFHSVEKR